MTSTFILCARAASELHDFLQQSRGGLPRHKRKNDDFSAVLFDDPTLLLVQGVQGVVPPFDVDVRASLGKKARGCLFGKDANSIHTLQRSQNSRPVPLRIQRTPRTLQLCHRSIPVDSHQKSVSKVAGRFQVCHMAQMQQVKTAVGDNQPLARIAERRPPLLQLVPGYDFFLKMHPDILAKPFPALQRHSKGGKEWGRPVPIVFVLGKGFNKTQHPTTNNPTSNADSSPGGKWRAIPSHLSLLTSHLP